METADLVELGIDPERLERVRASLQHDIDSGYIHGAALRVGRRGKVVFDFAAGHADKVEGLVLQADSTFVTMSTGKLFTVVLVLGLVERGLLRLHAPVADVIPEFGKYGKEGVTLFHLLTHTSGVPGGVPAADPAILASIEKLTDYACSLPLEGQPGERVNYSMAVAHSVLATMCLCVNGRGRSFATMLTEDLFQPLGMSNTSLGPRDDLLGRLCPVRSSQSITYDLLPPEAIEFLSESVILAPGSEFPAGGFISTLDDLYRFTEMLRRGGEFGGVRLLSPAMLKLATTNHTGNLRNGVWDPVLSIRHWQSWPAYIGLGFRLRGEGVVPGPFGVLNSPGTFGHFGAGSSGIWVDPERDLSCSLLTTGLLEESHSLERTAKLADLIISAIVT